jgi:hypothetical protein
MIEKMLGLSDRSIMKKSSYYFYMLAVVVGIGMIILALGNVLFCMSDTHQGVVMAQQSNIEYLKSLSQKINDPKLLDIADRYALNYKSLLELNKDLNAFSILFGFLLIMQFFLFKKLRNKVIAQNHINDKDTK